MGVEHTAVGLYERLTDRLRPIHPWRLDVANVCHGRGLGHPIPLVYLDAGKLCESAWQFGGKRRSPRLQPSDSVILRKLPSLCRLIKRIQGRRNDWHHRDALVYHQMEQLRYVEARHQHKGGSEHQHRIERDVESVDVIERKKTQHDVVDTQVGTIRSNQLIDVGDKIEVRKHHAFREARGSTRIGKCGESEVGGFDGLW